MQGQPLMGEPWAGHSAAAAAAAAAGAAGQALLPASCLGPCPCCPQIPVTAVPATPSASCLPHSPTQGLLSILLQTMDLWVFWFLLLQSVIQYPQPVGDVLDTVTQVRMEARAMQLELERLRLEQEMEQLRLRQSLQVLTVRWLLSLVLCLLVMESERSLRREEHEEANEEDDDGNEVDHRVQDNIGRRLLERIQWPVQDLRTGCDWTTDLMDNFTMYFGHVLSGSFYPALQRAIGVGSAFEGWSPREQDFVYRVLIPMTPPRGHSFHLELDTAGQRHGRNFRVRVRLECTCTREQQGENLLCFLHHREEELRSNQAPSLLDTLCTGSYLDVHKTARWFYQLVRAIWPALPQSHTWHLVLLPSRRSCQFKVTNGTESFRIEMLFGLRQGDSDVFVSSQPRGAGTPSTVWPESYAVAEMKFFKYIARQAPPDSLHLRCLQFFSRVQLGIGFSTYTIKTIAMHLLNTRAASQWRRRHFLRRLVDINESLRLALIEKRLNHFIVGNTSLPEEISLPPDVQMAEPPNLFRRLAMDPGARYQAVSEYLDLQRRIKAILNPGR